MPRAYDNYGLQCCCLLVERQPQKRVNGSETKFTIAGNTTLSILYLTMLYLHFQDCSAAASRRSRQWTDYYLRQSLWGGSTTRTRLHRCGPMPRSDRSIKTDG